MIKVDVLKTKPESWQTHIT